jgi:hypothetical protein
MQAFLIGGFSCGLAVCGSIYGFVVLYRSLFGAVDVITND